MKRERETAVLWLEHQMDTTEARLLASEGVWLGNKRKWKELDMVEQNTD
jgi:hypothetical protein